MAAGVGGDPDRLVGGDDPPVERRGRRRVGLPAEQHGDEGVDEQGPAGEGVGAGDEVEGVDPDARGAEVDVGAADPVSARRRYSSSGSTTTTSMPDVQRAQRFELGQVATCPPPSGPG